MNILLVNSGDAGGGAEQVASELFRSYGATGHDAWFVVGQKRTANPRVVAVDGGSSRAPLARLRRRWGQWRGHENYRAPGSRRVLDTIAAPMDLVHCHNLHGQYFDLPHLAALSNRLPVVLTLHDAWLLSGHCAHSFDCDRWKTGCGKCPDLSIFPAIRRDATAHNWRRKQEILASGRFYVATPSRWLMKKLQQSPAAPTIRDARVIPNGVDLATFRAGYRSVARSLLGIDQAAQVVLFVANQARANPFKDYHTLRAALEMTAGRIAPQKALFICLGERAPAESLGASELRFVPFESDVHRVAAYLQAADVYVHAAKVETFPNTILEASACGTPTVASAVGGIPEQIKDDDNGFLVPPHDPEAIAARLVQLLGDQSLRESMGRRAADTARDRFGAMRMTSDYLAWFDEILAARAAPQRRTP